MPTVAPTPTPSPTPVVLPVVTVTTTGDGDAVEGGEAGKIAIRRAGGDSSLRLLVRYKVAGGATAGVDYKALAGSVIFPAGVMQMKVKIKAIDDTVQEGTRVAKVKLLPSLDGTYNIGTPAIAKVKIVDND